MTKRILSLLAVLFMAQLETEAQNFAVHANFHSMAIKIVPANSWDGDTNGYCKVIYRKYGSNKWLQSIAPDRIETDNEVSYRVSIFGLEEDTRYEIRAALYDTTPQIDSFMFDRIIAYTRKKTIVRPIGHSYWVAPNAQHKDYSFDKPGDLKSLLRSGLTCGSTVIFKDGSYKQGDLSLNINSICHPDSPITLMAADGARPILYGGSTVSLAWKQNPTDTFMYSAALPSQMSYSNLMYIPKVGRIYPYSTVGSNAFLGNYNLSQLNFGFDGFCRDVTSVYFKSKSGINPNTTGAIFSEQFRGLTIYGNDKNVFLQIKGLVFQFYGKSKVDLNGAYNARALTISNCQNVLIDSCEFLYNDNHLTFQNCQGVTVENCRFMDNVGDWSHAMIKKSFANQSVLYPTSLGRSLENASIQFLAASYGSVGVIYRYNHFQGSGDGVAFRAGSKGIQNVDFYGNTVRKSFDGVEFDGKFINLKVWNNVLDSNVASISVAPPQYGPSYFYRNEIRNMISRKNTADDTYYVECEPVTEYRSQGVAIKTNVGGPIDHGAKLYFINNTFHSRDSSAFIQYLWSDEWESITFKNNIFFNPAGQLIFHNGYVNAQGQPDSLFYYDSESDNFYNSDAPKLTVKKIHGQYNCRSIFEVDSIQKVWIDLTKSKEITISNPLSSDPEFIDEQNGDLRLNDHSKLIEQGVKVQGFYNFNGRQPDIGAHESKVDSTVSIRDINISFDREIKVWPSPFIDHIEVSNFKLGLSVKVYDINGRLWANAITVDDGFNRPFMLAGYVWIDTSKLPNGVYLIKVGNQSKKLVKVGRQ